MAAGEMTRAALAFMAAAIGGLILWTATAIAGGRAEPWDSEIYWTASYPAALVLSLGLGLAFPDRPWRWALVLIGSQLVVMASSPSDFGLLPLGLIVLAILSVPAAILAGLGAAIRRWVAA